MAYSISVAVGESDKIAAGRDATFTLPLAAAMETGKACPAAGLAPDVAPLLLAWVVPLHAAAVTVSAAAAARTARRRVRERMIISVSPEEAGPAATPGPGIGRTVLPPRTVRRHGPGVRAHPRPGITAGTSPLRDSAGIAPASMGSTPSRATRDRRTLPQPDGMTWTALRWCPWPAGPGGDGGRHGVSCRTRDPGGSRPADVPGGLGGGEPVRHGHGVDRPYAPDPGTRPGAAAPRAGPCLC